MPRAPLIVLSGPSGSGKSTLISRVLELFGPKLRHSISATTRLPRPGEVDGVHYHFWSRPRFEQAIANGEFLEYATVFGSDYYGTPRSEVEPYREQGIAVILDIDVQGAAQLRLRCPDATFVFLETPPGEYERRLRQRRTEPEEVLQRRLRTAQEELARAKEFDVRILNDDLDRATAELARLISQRLEAA